jgi:protein SCO1/2
MTNPYIWNFLTGSHAALSKIVIDGFKVPMGNKEAITKKLEDKTVTLMDIAHSDRVVLVDGLGQIRGYYSTEKSEMDRLMIDLGLLVNNSFSKPKINHAEKSKEI